MGSPRAWPLPRGRPPAPSAAEAASPHWEQLWRRVPRTNADASLPVRIMLRQNTLKHGSGGGVARPRLQTLCRTWPEVTAASGALKRPRNVKLCGHCASPAVGRMWGVWWAPIATASTACPPPLCFLPLGAGAWSLPGTLPQGRGPREPPRPWVAPDGIRTLLLPQEKWQQGSGWSFLGPINSQNRARK